MATTAKGFSYIINEDGLVELKMTGVWTEREIDSAIVQIRKQVKRNLINMKYKKETSNVRNAKPKS